MRRPARNSSPSRGTPAAISSVVFSPDGKRLAQPAAARTERREGVGCADRPGAAHLKGGGIGSSLAFSPDGHRLVGEPGGTVTIWDATPLPEK